MRLLAQTPIRSPDLEPARRNRLHLVECLRRRRPLHHERRLHKKLVMLWNGTNWSLQTLADPEGAVQTTLLDVSCTLSPTRCTAVGGWKNSAGEQFTLAFRFNGSTWTLQSTPNPLGTTESVFQDVSCATETSCTAAGHSVSGGSTKTLAEKWNGTSWSIQSTPNPSSATFSSLFASPAAAPPAWAWGGARTARG